MSDYITDVFCFFLIDTSFFCVQSRSMLLGECVPASCSGDALGVLLQASEQATVAKASALGVSASLVTLVVRPVPGGYDVYSDIKFQILGYVQLLVVRRHSW